MSTKCHCAEFLVSIECFNRHSTMTEQGKDQAERAAFIRVLTNKELSNKQPSSKSDNLFLGFCSALFSPKHPPKLFVSTQRKIQQDIQTQKKGELIQIGFGNILFLHRYYNIARCNMHITNIVILSMLKSQLGITKMGLSSVLKGLERKEIC